MIKDLRNIDIDVVLQERLIEREGHRKKLRLVVRGESGEAFSITFCECSESIDSLLEMLEAFKKWSEEDEIPVKVKELREGLKEEAEENINLEHKRYIG